MSQPSNLVGAVVKLRLVDRDPRDVFGDVPHSVVSDVVAGTFRNCTIEVPAWVGEVHAGVMRMTQGEFVQAFRRVVKPLVHDLELRAATLAFLRISRSLAELEAFVREGGCR